VSKPAERGGDNEYTERDQEDAPPPEEVRRPPSEKEKAAVAEHVRAHHPLQRARRQVEVAADRRQSDSDHRDVERIQEEGAAQHEQRAPGPPAQPAAVVEGIRAL
jgi:hypothetical protein